MFDQVVAGFLPLLEAGKPMRMNPSSPNKSSSKVKTSHFSSNPLNCLLPEPSPLNSDCFCFWIPPLPCGRFPFKCFNLGQSSAVTCQQYHYTRASNTFLKKCIDHFVSFDVALSICFDTLGDFFDNDQVQILWKATIIVKHFSIDKILKERKVLYKNTTFSTLHILQFWQNKEGNTKLVFRLVPQEAKISEQKLDFLQDSWMR